MCDKFTNNSTHTKVFVKKLFSTFCLQYSPKCRLE